MSLYQRLHDVQRSETPELGRDPVLDELRQRVHHLLIDEVGPLLYDRRIGEDELRRQLLEHLKVILGRERVPARERPVEEHLEMVQHQPDGPGEPEMKKNSPPGSGRSPGKPGHAGNRGGTADRARQQHAKTAVIDPKGGCNGRIL